MLHLIPPPVFKYDVANMENLNEQISHWEERRQLPQIELKKVVAGQNAIYQLPDILSYLGVQKDYEVICTMDHAVHKRGEQEVKPLVLSLLEESGYQVKKIIFEDDEYGQVHPTFKEVGQVIPQLHEKCAVISIGSGVVTDVTKHACYLWKQEAGVDFDLPLISCMTSCSAPAYASRSSIISKDGVKRTWPSRTPDVIIADYRILVDSPMKMTVAGIGDLFPIFCSYADWYLADKIGMASFLDCSWRIMDDVKELLVPYSEKIAAKDLVGIEVLAKCITLCGLAMTYARDSVPMSGYEHVMSHLIDMSAEHDKRATGLHGEQVGVNILFSLAQYELLIEYLDENYQNISLDDCYPSFEETKERVLAAYHDVDPSDAMGNECWNDIKIKLTNWIAARPKTEEFIKNWPENRETLKKLVPYTAAECAKAFALSGHPLLPSELQVPVTQERMRWVLQNARFQRKRFTSADLVGFLNLYTPEWEEKIIEKVEKAVKEVKR